MDTLSRFIANVVNTIIEPLIVLLIWGALVFFLYGAAQFILNAADPEARKKGQQALIWGLIGLFIMASVFGILRVVTGTFGVGLPN